MKYFKLPDLGEGLQDAEIVEWHVAPGDAVSTDQVIVSVETAKAIVDVPSPQTGVIMRRFGEVGDTLHTGQPLIEYEGADDDTGTVVGKVESHQGGLLQETIPLAKRPALSHNAVLATPAVRALAQALGVELNGLVGSGQAGIITAEDVRRAATRPTSAMPMIPDATPLRGARRNMANAMSQAHAEVVKVTLCDDVDVHAWHAGNDPTLRLIRAVVSACSAVPMMNAWYDGRAVALSIRPTLDLGIAIDSEHGLYVPVMRDVGRGDPLRWREDLDALRAGVRDRSLPPAAFLGATLSLSNFGTLAGRYADPVIVPPAVCILGAGRIRLQPVVTGSGIEAHRVLPLSLSFDHRALTGGEAARALRALMDDLTLAE